MKDKLTICVFHLGFVYSGGGEKLVLTQSIGLQKKGHKVDVFTPVLNKKICFPELISKVRVRQMLPSFNFLPEWESFQVILTCILAPFIARRYRKYDVIFAANQPSSWIASWVKVLYGVPYVSYLAQPTRFIYPRKIDKEEGLVFARKHPVSFATLILRLTSRITKRLDTKSVQNSDTVLSNGQYIKKLIDKTYSVRSKMLSAPTVPSKTVTSRKKRGQGILTVKNKLIQKPYLLVTNRHFPQKRFEYAFFVLQSFVADSDSMTLVVTGGETEYTSYLRELADELSLSKHIVFTGLVSEIELKKLYQNAYVYLYTAPEEDYGMGIIEAMGAGVPVVVWEKAGPKYLVENRVDGMSAKSGDLSAFIQSAHTLVHDRALYNTVQKNAYEKIKRVCDVDRHIDKLEKHLVKAISV